MSNTNQKINIKRDKILAFFFNGEGLQTSKIDENKNIWAKFAQEFDMFYRIRLFICRIDEQTGCSNKNQKNKRKSKNTSTP